MQIKSKQRVADHGEVYTREREVNAMLDLVADQAENPEKTFLEPACGTGNFLVEILRRKLAAAARKHRKVQSDYERTLVVAVGSLYGIELLPDNASECRERLFQTASSHYQTAFPKTFKTQCLNSVRYILQRNIICGDALSFKTVVGEDIVFSEWKAVNRSQIKRRDYVFRNLLADENQSGRLLFSPDSDKQLLISERYKEDYPLIHFLEVGNV